MVTILEPRETLPLEPVASEPVAATELLPPEAETPRGEPVEWRFSMPCAGVRYFSFGPAAPKTRPAASHRTISAKLIDEKVILL